MEELEVLKIVTKRLAQAEIPYMMTGSFATNFYAIPRMTRDIDLVIALSLSDVDRFVQLFQNDFYTDREMVASSVASRDMFNIIHNDWVIKVDFILLKNTEYQTTEFERRRPIEIDGQKMWIISAEDLILSKMDWAKESESEMQIRDVKNILQHAEIDIQYVEKWVGKLGLGKIYQKVRA